MRLLALSALSIVAAVYATPMQMQNNGMRMTEKPLRPHEPNHLIRRELGPKPKPYYANMMAEHDWFYAQCMSNWIAIKVYNIMYRPHLAPQTPEELAKDFDSANGDCVKATWEAFELYPTARLKRTDMEQLIKDTLQARGAEGGPHQESNGGNGDGDKNRGPAGNEFNSIVASKLEQSYTRPVHTSLGDQVKGSLDRFSNGVTNFLSKVANPGHPSFKPMSIPAPDVPVKPGIDMPMPMPMPMKLGPL